MPLGVLTLGWRLYIRNYRIARNFCGLKFSRIALRQIFRDLIFEDVAYVQTVCPAHLTDYTREIKRRNRLAPRNIKKSNQTLHSEKKRRKKAFQGYSELRGLGVNMLLH